MTGDLKPRRLFCYTYFGYTYFSHFKLSWITWKINIISNVFMLNMFEEEKMLKIKWRLQLFSLILVSPVSFSIGCRQLKKEYFQNNPRLVAYEIKLHKLNCNRTGKSWNLFCFTTITSVIMFIILSFIAYFPKFVLWAEVGSQQKLFGRIIFSSTTRNKFNSRFLQKNLTIQLYKWYGTMN